MFFLLWRGIFILPSLMPKNNECTWPKTDSHIKCITWVCQMNRSKLTWWIPYLTIIFNTNRRHFSDNSWVQLTGGSKRHILTCIFAALVVSSYVHEALIPYVRVGKRQMHVQSMENVSFRQTCFFTGNVSATKRPLYTCHVE